MMGGRMGRPPEGGRVVQIRIPAEGPDSLLQWIDDTATAAGLSRSKRIVQICAAVRQAAGPDIRSPR